MGNQWDAPSGMSLDRAAGRLCGDGQIYVRDGCGACKGGSTRPTCRTCGEGGTKNVVTENASGVGHWGGSCTCPDGSVYQVGDNVDHCGSLACVGGKSGTCNKKHGPWSRRKVTCAPLSTGMHYLAKGRMWSRIKERPRFADNSEKHEVRCCSSTEISGWTKRTCLGKPIWTESDGKLGACQHAMTWDQAHEHCTKAGGRLCSRAEAEANCIYGTGCGHDEDLVWTSAAPSAAAPSAATRPVFKIGTVGRRLDQKSDTDEVQTEELNLSCLHADYAELEMELGLDASGPSLRELIASGDIILDNPEDMEDSDRTLADLGDCNAERSAVRDEDPNVEEMAAPAPEGDAN